jgi:hypothetical protein
MTCPKCSSHHITHINRLRYLLLLSTLPVLAALIIGFTVFSIFLLCIPIILLINFLAVRKKPSLYICQKCKFRWEVNSKVNV